MTQQVTFGRRGLRATTPAPARQPVQPEPSSQHLDAFVASLRESKPSDAAEFARWRRDQLPRRLLMVAVSLALMAPGAFCFAFKAPWWISLGLEAAGVAGGIWLRRERRRQASAIAAWEPGAEA